MMLEWTAEDKRRRSKPKEHWMDVRRIMARRILIKEVENKRLMEKKN